MTLGIALLILIGLVVLIVLWLVVAYNGLVRLRNQLENAWAQIDVQLKRRHDLIPNLIETVKGYAAHERGTFEKVAQARAAAASAQGVQERAQAENVLTATLKSLFAVAEAYPQLKANQNFMQLQEELTSTENRIAFARQFYNDATMQFNTRIQVFPTNLIAGPFGFAAREFFEVAAAAEREAPGVKF